MNEKLPPAQACYKKHFDRTERCTPKFYAGQHVFLDILPAQMSKSAPMASAPLTELLPKSLRPFKVISPTLYAVTVDGVGIHNTVSIHIVPLALYNAQGNDRTDQDSETKNTSNCSNEDKTGGNNARIMGEIPVQHIVKHDETGKRIKYIV